MNEDELDSSKELYIEEQEAIYNSKKEKWDMAIGLQKIDNLKPSKYLLKLSEENVIGKKTVYEVEQELKQYYDNKKNNHKEYECDLVSTRIVKLLEENNFELSVNYLKYIHKYLFKGIYEFAGNYRKVNITKRERILNSDTVIYGDYKTIEKSLNYDISLEKTKKYKSMNIVNIIYNITDFTSRIWQVHPFREGNTRAIALFIEKYLTSIGYDTDNTVFKDKSIYFRNALVRAN